MALVGPGKGMRFISPIEDPCSKLQSACGGSDREDIVNSLIRSLTPSELRGMRSLLRFNAAEGSRRPS